MILVFGTVCIDRARQVPFLPPPGGYVGITAETDFLGGEAANTAIALRKWGVESELWGNCEGEGPDGQNLRDLLQAAGIENHLSRPGTPLPTPVCDIYITPDGERTMFGRGFDVMEKGVDVTKLPYERGAWFTAEPNMREAAQEAARLAHQAGMKLYLMDFLDPKDIPEGSYWQGSTDWVGGRNNRDENISWVQDWTARTGCFAILTDGANGFVAGGQGMPVRSYPPFPVLNIVDGTGSGDAFRAGMLLGLSLFWPLPDCLAFAAAAGGLNSRALGAMTGLPTEQEVHDYVRNHLWLTQLYR
jgi:sugar/nucleoside kinase (ribokinase family)